MTILSSIIDGDNINDDLNNDLVEGTKKGSPQFEHDCDTCCFMANLEYNGRLCDIYLCGRDGSRTIIARHSSDGPDYTSYMLFGCVDLTPLDRFALSHGLLLNEIEKKRLLECLLRMDKVKWTRKMYTDLAPKKDKEHALGPIDWYGWDY